MRSAVIAIATVPPASIVIEVRFYLALALVLGQFPEFLQIVCCNGFQNIVIVIFSRVDHKVLFAVLGKRYGFAGSGRLQSFGMFDIRPASEKALSKGQCHIAVPRIPNLDFVRNIAKSAARVQVLQHCLVGLAVEIQGDRL